VTRPIWTIIGMLVLILVVAGCGDQAPSETDAEETTPAESGAPGETPAEESPAPSG
jgi:hypothetical protein